MERADARVADEARRRRICAQPRRTSSKSRVGMNPCAPTTGAPAVGKRLAKIAAKEAVSEKFLSLGMNISNPISVEGQFASCEIFTTRRVTSARS